MSSVEHCVRLGHTEYARRLESDLGQFSLARELAPLVTKREPAFWARYPYGAAIIRNGAFRLPPCPDATICEPCRELQEALARSATTIPLTLVVRNGVEVYVPANSDQEPPPDSGWAPSRPMRLLSAGELFGVFETLDALGNGHVPKPIWEVSAGIRSIVLITSELSRNSMKRLSNLLIEGGATPEASESAIRAAGRSDAWELLKLLVDSSNSLRPHSFDLRDSEVLVFPFAANGDAAANKSATSLLRVAQVGWEQSRHFRNYLAIEETLSRNPHLKATTVHRDAPLTIISVVRQVLSMARGEVPAFAPAPDLARTLGTALVRLDQTGKNSAWPLLLLQPVHLKKAGESAYISFKYNCLPWLGAKWPTKTKDEFCKDVRAALASHAEGVLDIRETKVFNKKGALLDILEASGWPEWSAKVSSQRPFLTGCLRIVRGSS